MKSITIIFTIVFFISCLTSITEARLRTPDVMMCPKVIPGLAGKNSCYEIYSPVVGFHANGTAKVYDNDCYACINTDVNSYQPVSLCSLRKNFDEKVQCPQYFSPACAVNDKGEFKQASNGCFACANTSYKGFFDGTCPSVAQKCAPEAREGRFCIEIYDPVCGYTATGEKKTFSNSCFACIEKNMEIINWTKGSCPK